MKGINAKNNKKPFNQKVWDICKKIPNGRVSTYKEIGKAIGTKGYRAVGTAFNKNPYAPIVPCHRVVNSDGKIGDFTTGKDRKARLLIKEGIIIKNEKIINFKQKFISLIN
jgi:methylated-DNA-[protein]-cysteine S-methyltransferase